MNRCATLLLLLTLPLIAACPVDDEPPPAGDSVDPLSWAVDELGPFNVGYRAWEITYPGAGGGEDRTIPVHVWYPTEDTAGEPVTYEFIFADDNSWIDAAPAPAVHESGYPVLAYSHGSQGFAGSSSFVMRTFASHGWVAVAPDHLGNTLSTHSSPLPLDLYLDRSADLSAAIDSLEAGDAGLPSPIDTSQILANGHSFGCHTMWASMGATFDVAAITARCDSGEIPEDQCTPGVLEAFAAGLRDPRIVATVPMAGGGAVSWFGEGGLLGAETPMLYMSGTDDPGAVDDVWERSEGLDMTWMVIEGGCHQLFGLGVCPQIDDEVGVRAVRTYSLAFGRKHVLGDEGATTEGLLDGSIELAPEVTITPR